MHAGEVYRAEEEYHTEDPDTRGFSDGPVQGDGKCVWKQVQTDREHYSAQIDGYVRGTT